jgi:hypothetical protein
MTANPTQSMARLIIARPRSRPRGRPPRSWHTWSPSMVRMPGGWSSPWELVPHHWFRAVASFDDMMSDSANSPTMLRWNARVSAYSGTARFPRDPAGVRALRRQAFADLLPISQKGLTLILNKPATARRYRRYY